MMVAWGNFVTLGCPSDPTRYVKDELRGAPRGSSIAATYGTPTPLQTRLVESLVGDVQPFFRLAPDVHDGAGSGKQATFLTSLTRLAAEESDGSSPAPPDLRVVGAKDVMTSRARLPDVAALCDPADWLKGDRKEIFSNLTQHIRLPEEEWPDPLPRAVHKVSPEEQASLCRAMIKCGMAKLILEEEVLRRADGTAVTGGLFCVAHKPLYDRLIFDRRPPNSTEAYLPWCDMPAGFQLADLLVGDSECMRASGRDLSCYYYVLKQHTGQIPSNAVGPVLKGEEWTDVGGIPGRRFRLALLVPGMGDRNAAAVAQATHEAILTSGGALEEKSRILYSQPVPETTSGSLSTSTTSTWWRG